MLLPLAVVKEQKKMKRKEKRRNGHLLLLPLAVVKELIESELAIFVEVELPKNLPAPRATVTSCAHVL